MSKKTMELLKRAQNNFRTFEHLNDVVLEDPFYKAARDLLDAAILEIEE
jgi:hypothetical protein